MKTIKITVKQDGTTELVVSGVKGDGCFAITQEIEESLGDIVVRTPNIGEIEEVRAVLSQEH